MILNALNVSKSVNTKSGTLNILNNISLSVPASTSVAIVGSSGSGKSTLLGLLAGLDTPSSGEIKLNNQVISQLSENQRAVIRAKSVGFVFQSFYLMEDLTALENVALPLELFGIADAIPIAEQWLNKLGMSDRADHFPKQLSGGEQQRVALCRAFAVKPSIMFADEPTANLDEQTATVVADQLFGLYKENSSSVVIATHDLTLAKRCDVIYQLKSGKLNEYA